MKPTVKDIRSRYESYMAYYATLHQQQKETDDYYELVFDAGVPKRYPTRMPSTARDWIDNGVMHFTLDNPKSRVYPRNSSEAARNQVERLETLYDFWLKKDILKIKDAARKLPLRGQVFLRVDMDDTYFGSNGEERLFHFPLSLSVPDPINVFASPAQNGLIPVDVVECFYITVAEAQELCERNKWKWETSLKPDEKVEWFSYYSNKWRCFMIDEKPVLPGEVQPNILEICPYVHVPAGSGQTSYEGKPEYLYRSLLWGKRDMLKMEVRNLSQIDAINSRYAWIRHKAKGVPEEIKKLYPRGIPTDPDELLLEVEGRVEILTLQGEQPPQGLYQQQAMVQSYAHPPQVLGGGRPVGVYSGQHQETLLATAKPIYKTAFKNLEDALGVTMGVGARILEKVYKSPLEIKNFADDSERMYSKISPSDINGHYDCEVRLLAEPPEANDLRKGLGKALWQAGAISMRTMLRDYFDMSQKEVEDEMAQLFAEMAMKQPALMDVLAKHGMERMGMDKELEALNEAQRAAAKPIPPNRQGEGYTGRDLARVRGRVSPELESAPTPHEREVMRV